MSKVTLVVKGADEKRLREFKAEAIRRGLRLAEALEEAIELWLSAKPLLDEVDANNLAYLRARRRLEGQQGKYAVFAFGRLIGVFESLEEVSRALRSLEARPRHAVVVKIGVDKPGELEWLGGSISP